MTDDKELRALALGAANVRACSVCHEEFLAACDPQTILSLLDRLQAAERERDRAVEVADAETKGVYSKYMLEAADAIVELHYLRLCEDPVGDLARALIKLQAAERIPREPTEAMLDAGYAYVQFNGDRAVADLWRAMYDAAQGAQDTPGMRDAITGYEYED